MLGYFKRKLRQNQNQGQGLRIILRFLSVFRLPARDEEEKTAVNEREAITVAICLFTFN